MACIRVCNEELDIFLSSVQSHVRSKIFEVFKKIMKRCIRSLPPTYARRDQRTLKIPSGFCIDHLGHTRTVLYNVIHQVS